MIRLLTEIVGVALSARVPSGSREIGGSVNLAQRIRIWEVGAEEEPTGRASHDVVPVLYPAVVSFPIDVTAADRAGRQIDRAGLAQALRVRCRFSGLRPRTAIV